MSINDNINTVDPGTEHFPPEKKVFDNDSAGADKTETRLAENISVSDKNKPKKSDLDINCGNGNNVVGKDGNERNKVKPTSAENVDVDDAGDTCRDGSLGDKSEPVSGTQPEAETASEPVSKDGKDSEHKETELTESKEDSAEPGPAEREDEPIDIDQPTGDDHVWSRDEAEQDEIQSYTSQSANEDDQSTFIKYGIGDFDTDSDLNKLDSDSSDSNDMGALKSKGKGAVSKKQKCQGSSSEDDSDRPWRGAESGSRTQKLKQSTMTPYVSSAKTKKDQSSHGVLPSRLQRGGLAHLKKQWSDKDTLQYRMGYPGKRDNPRERMNLDFYQGRIQSKPDGAYIDDFHKHWWDNYDRLESHHGYIQWLFPIRETGMNWQAQELQLHEAKAIRENKMALDRFMKSYQMMLNFYGIRLVNRSTGKLTRADNWKARFRHLNYSMHNYLRITRILKCLGEMGLEHYKYPFLSFMLHEAIVTGKLDRTLDSCYNYWIGTIKDDATREKLRTRADRLYRGEAIDDEEEEEEEHSKDEEGEAGRVKGSVKDWKKLRRAERGEEDEEDIDVDY